MRTSATKALVLALLLFAPLASAGYDFGSFVGKSDYDYTPMVKAKDVRLCWISGDDTTYVPGGVLYLHLGTTCATNIAVDDLRLIGLFGGEPGSEVEAADVDEIVRAFAGELSHELKWFDADHDGKLKSKDVIYLDLFNVDGDRVDVGDIRLNAFGDHAALSIVQAGDPDQAFAIAHLPKATDADPAKFGQANRFYKAASAYYLNTDGDDLATQILVEDNDLRLNDAAKDPLGSLQATMAPAFGAPALTVTGLKAVPTGANSVLVILTVQNTGDVTGSGLVQTHLDGVLVDARGTPTLASGQSTELVLLLPVTAGTHALAAGDQEASVETPVAGAAPIRTQSASAASKQDTPGLGGALAFLALGVAAFVARRK